MKKYIYRIFYKVSILLADVTGGAKMPVRIKLALGTILIGMAAASCTGTSQRPQPTCYDPAAPDSTTGATTAQDSLQAQKPAEPKSNRRQLLKTRKIETCMPANEPVMCYKPAIIHHAVPTQPVDTKVKAGSQAIKPNSFVTCYDIAILPDTVPTQPADTTESTTTITCYAVTRVEEIRSLSYDLPPLMTKAEARRARKSQRRTNTESQK